MKTQSGCRKAASMLNGRECAIVNEVTWRVQRATARRVAVAGTVVWSWWRRGRGGPRY